MAASVDGGDTGSGCRGDSNNKGHHIPLPSIVVTKKREKKKTYSFVHTGMLIGFLVFITPFLEKIVFYGIVCHKAGKKIMRHFLFFLQIREKASSLCLFFGDGGRRLRQKKHISVFGQK